MIEEIRSELASFMEQTGKNQSQIAKETNLSTATISQFLGGIYGGDNTKIAKTLKKYLKLAQNRRNVIRTETFYEGLRNTRTALFAAEIAHTKCEIVLLSGAAGAGKTTALKHYVENSTGVIFVTANCCTSSATAILGEISLKIGKTPKTKKQLLMNELVSYFKDSQRLIIIDEADHLTFSALQALRNLNDEAGVGILLSGNDKIYNQMVCGAKSGEFDQLRTRMFIRPKVTNEYTIEEIQGVFPDIDMPSTKVLLEVAQAESLRTARKLYNMSAELANANNQKFSAAHLKRTCKQFLGVL